MDLRPVAVVSDAGSAVGRATAIALAAAGHDVAVIATTGAHLDDLAVAVLRHGARSVAIEVDRHDMVSMQPAAAEVERRLGEIETWIDVASFGPLDDSYLARAIGPVVAIELMAARNRGVVVCVNSAASYRPEPDHPTEAAEAFALRGFFQALRTDLLRRGLDLSLVNVVAPPAMLRAGWGDSAGEAEQATALGRSIVRAAHRGRQHHVHGFGTWLAVLGARLAPGVSDHLIAMRAGRPAIEHRSAADAARELGTAAVARTREVLHLAASS